MLRIRQTRFSNSLEPLKRTQMMAGRLDLQVLVATNRREKRWAGINFLLQLRLATHDQS